MAERSLSIPDCHCSFGLGRRKWDRGARLEGLCPQNATGEACLARVVVQSQPFDTGITKGCLGAMIRKPEILIRLSLTAATVAVAIIYSGRSWVSFLPFCIVTACYLWLDVREVTDRERHKRLRLALVYTLTMIIIILLRVLVLN